LILAFACNPDQHGVPILIPQRADGEMKKAPRGYRDTFVCLSQLL